MDVAYRYRPRDRREHYAGIPARDLTAADLAAMTDEQRALVANGALYEAVAAPVAARVAGRRAPASPTADGEVSDGR